MAPIDFRILAAFAATYILWGGTFLGVALALPAIPPFLLMGARSLTGGLMLYAYARYSGTKTPARLWLIAGIAGLFLFVGCHGAMAYAQQRVPSGVTALFMASIPFWMVIVGFLVPGRTPSRLISLALLVPGLAGVGFIALDQIGGRSRPALFDIALLLGSSLAWAVGSIFLERKSTRDVSAVTLSSMALIVGGLALIGISAASGEMARFDPARLTASAVLGFGYLVLAGTIAAFGSYVWLLERVSPTLVATYTFVNPVIAVLLGWAVLGETFSLSTLTGGALVVASIVGLLLFTPSKKPAAKGSEARDAMAPAGLRIGQCSNI